MRERRPPLLAHWLLRRLCRSRLRDVVEGDVEELYRIRLASVGPRRANRRYWADVLSLIGTASARVRRNRTHGSARSVLSEEIMNVISDLRHAIRSLVKTPAFSAVVVITLALAIGANSAIFGVVDAVLLRPLPYLEPGSIVVVNQPSPDPEGMSMTGASQSLFLAWRESGRAFDHVAFHSQQEGTITSLDEPVRLNGAAVSPALFPLLRVDAAYGRTFAPDEELPGQDDVILLEYRMWQRHFGGDPSAIGSTVTLDERGRTIVGVMPPGFQFPDASIEYWVPMLSSLPEAGAPRTSGSRVSEEIRRERRGGPGGGGPGGGPDGGPDGGGPGGGPDGERHIELWGRVVARLADGVTAAMASEEGTTLLRGLEQSRGDRATGLGDGAAVDVVPMQEQLVGSVRRSLLTLMGAVAFVLLIACANVANLVMARSAGRRKETAVRSALGAGWWTLSRYLLLESLVLAVAGGIVGVGIAFAGLRILGAMGPEFIPRLEGVGVDGRVLGFTLAVTVLTAVLFSIVPARGASRLDLTRALKEEQGNAGLGLGRDALRRLLVTAEVALSVVLLVGAGLLVSSFIRLSSVDPGYDPSNLLHLHISLPADAYADAPAHLNFYDALIARFESLPGVAAATVASQPPYLPANIRIAMSTRRDNEPPSPDDRPTPVGVRVVENRYFDTLRASAAQGRTMSRDDRAETQPVAVLSESAAEAIFGDREVGERIPFMGGQEVEVVGITEDVRTSGVDPTPQPDVFLPYRQAPERMIPMLFRTAHVLVRTGPAPLGVLPALRDSLRQIDRRVLVLSVATVSDRIANSVAEPRFYATLVAAFAVLALSLAAVGIYGLLSYTVQESVRETAIRRALGAPVGRILRTVVTEGMVLAGIGLVVGMGAAAALTRLLESMLYEIEPTDPASFAGVVAVFLAVALLAVFVPARRATRIDPMDVLRYD